MADHTHTSRRAFLKGTPIAAVAFASGGAALAEDDRMDSPIMQLFREWESGQAALDDMAISLTDEQVDELSGVQSELERRILAKSSRSAEDVLAKVCARTDYGHFGLMEEDIGTFRAEARTFLRSDHASEAASPVADTSAPHCDPHPAWLAEWRELVASINDLPGPSSDEAYDQLLPERERLEQSITTTRATTREGLLAQLDYMIEDYGDMYLFGNIAGDWDRKGFESLRAGIAGLA